MLTIYTLKLQDNEEDEVILDTIETFKRQPTGIDSNGAAYYYFDMLETSGFRLYKEVPAATQIILNNTSSEDEDDAIDLTADGEYQLPEGPQKGTWEVVADTLEELEAEGQRLLESTKKADKELGRTILEEFVVQIKEREEAEERKRKAEERVKARLGVLAQEDILPRYLIYIIILLFLSFLRKWEKRLAYHMYIFSPPFQQ